MDLDGYEETELSRSAYQPDERRLGNETDGLHAVQGSSEAARAVVILDDNLHNRLESTFFFAPLMTALSDHASVAAVHTNESSPEAIERYLEAVGNWLKRSPAGGRQLFVLIDFYLGPIYEGQSFGPVLWQRFAEAFPNAKMAWMSSGVVELEDAELVNRMTFYKSEFFQGLGETPPQLPQKMLRWLGIAPPQASKLWDDAADWEKFRETVHEIVYVERGDDRNDGDWPHHLPGGGEPQPSAGQYWTGVFESVKPALAQEVPQLREFPDFCWEQDESGWDRPPIRSLIQFDGKGEDLKKALDSLKKNVEQALSRGENRLATLEWNVAIRGENSENQPEGVSWNWLWFYFFPFGAGLVRFAEQFRSYVEDNGDRQCSYTWRADIEVLCSDVSSTPDTLQLKVRIDQSVECRGNREVVKIPKVTELKGTSPLKEAYEFLERAGAEARNRDGAIAFCLSYSRDQGLMTRRQTRFYRHNSTLEEC